MTVLLPQFDQTELDEAHSELMGYLQVLKMRISNENPSRNDEAVEVDRARRVSFELSSEGMIASDIEEPLVTRAQYVDYNARNGVKNGFLDVENGESGDSGAFGATRAQDVDYSTKKETKYDNIDVSDGEYSVENERGSHCRVLPSSEVPVDTHLLLSNGFSSLHSLRIKASNTLHSLWR